MKCAWQSYINVLPHWMRKEIDMIGKDTLQELRLRVGRPVELVTQVKRMYLQRMVTLDDIDFCINVASRYSPWSANTITDGFITIEGGHRIGVCGNVSVSKGSVRALTKVTSLCIRVARDFPEIGKEIAEITESTLVIGPPGCGKTTLLRGIIQHKSNGNSGTIAVVDERGELFPLTSNGFCFFPGQCTDVLSGCGKRKGAEWLIRSMCPKWLALDEITSAEDCETLYHAAWCGVSLIATAHAGNRRELQNRSVYKSILESGFFKNLVIMKPDKTWVLERMEACS